MSTRSAGPSAVWVSGAFGFGDDLAYFRQVFAEFARRLPGSVVMVREGFPVDRYADLPLEPRLRFWTRRRDRVVDGFVYTGHRRVPTLRTAWRLLRWPADVVVVVEFTPTAVVTAATAHLARRRVVHLVESTPDFRGGADGRVARTIKGLVIGRSTVVQASNEATARYVVERLGVDPARVRTGPYLTSQPPGVEPAVDDGGPVRFLFLNSLQRRKGLHLLLPALAEAGRDGDHAPGRTWTLDVVGDGPERESAIALAEALGVADRVRWHGRVDHAAVAAHYAAAHVVCCPTQGDYRSLAGFEAVNAGRPVVLSTRDGAAAEICAHADAAVAVDPLDGPALRTALARYLRHDGFLADQLAAAATPPTVFGLDVVGENLAGAVRAAAR